MIMAAFVEVHNLGIFSCPSPMQKKEKKIEKMPI
jgi:hypothetical protein